MAGTKSYFREMTSVDSLHKAWDFIIHKSHTPGADKVTMEKYEKHLIANLETLSENLRTGSYIPHPSVEYKIPKHKPHTFRNISVSAVEDRIVQKSFLMTFAGFEATLFSKNSYAYIFGKGQKKAVGRIIHLVSSGAISYIAAGDIHAFFDSIPHEKLLEIFKNKITKENEVIELLSLWLRNGSVNNKTYKTRNIGIPQGYIISPFLANLFLTDFDFRWKCKDYHYIRYADNFIFLSAHSLDYVESLYTEAQRYLAELGLSLNKEDYQAVSVETGFSFLGIRFQGNAIVVDPKKEKKIYRDIHSLVNNTSLSVATIVNKINDKCRGYKNHYRVVTNKDSFFASIDATIIDRLAKRIVKKNRSSDINMVSNSLCLMSLDATSIRYKLKSRIAELTKLSNQVENKLGKRRRSYKQALALDGEYVIIGKGRTLRLKSGKLCVVSSQGSKEINLSKIKHIELNSQNNSITTNVIEKLSQANIPIFISDGLGRPVAKIMPASFSAMKEERSQIEALYNGKALRVAKKIVVAKMTNQLNLMRYAGKYRSDDVPFQEMLQQMKISVEHYSAIIDAMEEKELTRLRDRLLGYEGSIAALYWNLFGMTIKHPFTVREHRNAKNKVNIMLNYGYGILYNRIYEAIVRSYLNPHISYLHSEQKEKPTLVFDIIEMFRAPMVDRTVISLVNRGFEPTMEKSHILSNESRKTLAKSFLERLHAVVKSGKQEYSIADKISKTIKAFKQFLTGEQDDYTPYTMRW